MNLPEEIKNLVNKELTSAIKKWGLNHSYHEGYAVLLEEIDEAKDEIEIIEMLREDLWEYTKRENPENAITRAEDIAERAIEAASELVQVSAMARKYCMIPSHSEEVKK